MRGENDPMAPQVASAIETAHRAILRALEGYRPGDPESELRVREAVARRRFLETHWKLLDAIA